ncbi:ion channel [Taibaiella koreensis]|uniref:ion channel n=1 Tax=Taibaiella koreensis TaxID=1268548 RepID=UPI000E59D873|nr:ion channel [Taibaiella koreensis]
MNTHKQVKRPKEVNNSGFSGNSSAEGKRLLNKDGSANLSKTGIPFYQRFSIYHTLLKMSRMKFLIVVFLFYTTVNLFFAGIYMLIGTDKLSGGPDNHRFIDNFLHSFFFSSQTLTTVGYGHVAPVGVVANCIASIESFLGIMTFALVTGMFYARFSRPKAYIRFSDNFIVSPYQEGRAIMFRLATYKNNDLTDVSAEVTAAVHHMENGKRITRFYPLKLEISRINSLAISWTCVHYMNEESPFWQMREEDMMARSIELLVTIKGFDDHFSNTVQQRTSYANEELVYGARFVPMYERSESGGHTEVMLDRIGSFTRHSFVEEPDRQPTDEAG